MHYKVYYSFERSGEAVSSVSAVEMSARDIRRQLLGLLHGEDDFLGIIDGQDNVLQILCEPKAGRFWVELPLDAAKASWGRYMNLEELVEMVETLPAVLNRDSLPGLTYKPW
jgi:hypothetical protein